MQHILNDRTVKGKTVKDLKDLNSRSLSTQAEKGEHLDFRGPAIIKAFDLMGDDIIELSTENEFLKK